MTTVPRTGATNRFLARHLPIIIVSIVIVTLMVSPLMASFFASIKSPAEAGSVPPTYFPSEFSIRNFQTVWDYGAGLLTYVRNSTLTAFFTIALCLGLSVPAGFALARFRIPFKEVWFLLILASMMLPYQALLTPLYIMFSELKLTNSLFGLAIVHTILQLPFSTYIMRNACEAIPREMEEAAMVEGATSLQILTRIFLPLIAPGMVTVALFAFIMSWNEFIAALVFMSRESAFTVPVMLTGVSTGMFGTIDWGALQASVLISILPCVAIYLLLQRYYVSGLMSGAGK